MRKIELGMVTAIAEKRNWRRDNTRVVYDSMFDEVRVYLHNNLIAEFAKGQVTVRDAGWQTATTKSRLNAILFEHGKGIYQANWQWYVHDRWADETTEWDGSLTFEGSV
jgi:hypothetical protein